jgi:streptomycin 6-kinase
VSAFETQRRELRRFWLAEGSLPAVEWVDGLEERIDRCARRFALEVGEPLPGGSLAMVLAATTRAGAPVVLKLNPPLPELALEPAALAAMDGRGAVRILDADRSLGGLVLERAEPGPSLETALPVLEALEIAGRVAARTHVELPPGHPFPSGSVYLARIAIELPLRHVFAARALPGDVLELTLDACGRLAERRAGIGLANEDLHLGNILAAAREPWLLIDPKPWAAELAFSAGYLLRSACGGLPPVAVADALAVVTGALGVPWQPVRDWALVRAAAGVYERGGGPDPESDLALAVALSRL